MTTEPLRWGIISTGRIAHTLAHALSRSAGNRLVAVASRSRQRALEFAAEFSLSRAYDDYERLLADPELDVVYIATPHPSHAHWAMHAAQAKKHVLCEKPLAMNHAEARAVIQAARDNDVFLMEAFMYRCHPQTSKLVELVRSGTLGQVKAIHASFGIDGAYPAGSRLITNELGGGGILDLGCYPASMARLVAGAANAEPFSEPLELHATGYVGEQSCVDEYSVAILKFPGQILATSAASVKLWQDNGVRVFGSEGQLWLDQPWHPDPKRGYSEICIDRPDRAREVLRVPATQSAYDYEVAAVAAQITGREASQMTLADSLGNALTLDRWRRAIGVRFAADQLDA